MRKLFNPRVGFVERPALAAQPAPLSLIPLSLYIERYRRASPSSLEAADDVGCEFGAKDPR
jgi:hypothetical protein